MYLPHLRFPVSNCLQGGVLFSAFRCVAWSYSKHKPASETYYTHAEKGPCYLMNKSIAARTVECKVSLVQSTSDELCSGRHVPSLLDLGCEARSQARWKWTVSGVEERGASGCWGVAQLHGCPLFGGDFWAMYCVHAAAFLALAGMSLV